MRIGFFIKSLNAYHAHVKPFIEHAPEKNCSFIVFHLNSLYTPDFEIDNIQCETVDLSKKTNYKSELMKRNIDFFVSLNPGNLFDLLLIVCCKLLNICTIYYQHGIQLDFRSFNPSSLSRDKTLNKKKLTIKKYFSFYTIFLINLFHFNRKRLIIKTVYTKTKYLMKSKQKAVLPKYGLKFTHIDYAFVYGIVDKKYLISSMGMNSDNIIISGYPFIQQTKSPCKDDTRKVILYISSALREAGAIPISKEEEKEFYLKINKAAKNNGYKLWVKIHPQEDLNLFNQYFSNDDNVEIYKYENLANLTLQADIVLGDYSTALFYSIKYYKPILIIKSKFFENFPFDLTKFGIGRKINMVDLAVSLDKNDLTDDERHKYNFFLKNYIQSYNGELLYDIFFEKTSQLTIGQVFC